MSKQVKCVARARIGLARRSILVLGFSLAAGFLGYWAGAWIASIFIPDDGLILMRGSTILMYAALSSAFVALVAAVVGWRWTRASSSSSCT